MAAIATQRVTVTGIANVTFTAAAGGGDTFTGGARGIFHIRNASGSAITATIVVPGNTAYGQAQPDIAIIVPATTGHAMVGPFDSGMLDGNGNVNVTYSGVTSLTVAYTEV